MDIETQLSALTLGDLVELQQWLRQQPFRDLEHLPASRTETLLPEAARQSATLHLYAPAAQRLLQESIEAQAFVCYLMLRKRLPHWTFEQVLQEVSPIQLGRCAARFRALHGLDLDAALTDENSLDRSNVPFENCTNDPRQPKEGNNSSALRVEFRETPPGNTQRAMPT